MKFPYDNVWMKVNQLNIQSRKTSNSFHSRKFSVDEPCELGCDGLSFCTNFNNRPTELFRSCNANADSAARSVAEIWKDTQSLSLPGLNLPIKDISKCEPESWKAITCILQVKPCSRAKHTTQICREDCYDLLASCIDWTRKFMTSFLGDF